jgi:hypothetical protein
MQAIRSVNPVRVLRAIDDQKTTMNLRTISLLNTSETQ